MTFESHPDHQSTRARRRRQDLEDGCDIHRSVGDLDQFRSRIGFVFQHFHLFPHLSVLDNCMLAPMSVRGMTAAEAKDRVMTLLERVGLTHKATAFPAELSGGQQQRVGRA